MKNSMRVICLFVSSVSLAAVASAGDIYNNIDLGQPLNTGGRLIEGPDANNIGNVDQGARFNTGGHNHESISVAMAIGVTGPLPFDGRGPVAIQIWTDSLDKPATMLATSTINITTFDDQIISTNFPSLTLNANTNYWAVLDGLTTFQGAWFFNNTGANGATIGGGGGSWNPIRNPDPSGMLSLRVVSRVETVPEPATMAALGLGAAAMLRRRKKA